MKGHREALPFQGHPVLGEKIPGARDKDQEDGEDERPDEATGGAEDRRGEIHRRTRFSR
ncbi:MAG: hypothetical protein LBP95_10575 [Deltaproteobacteria bacterium]|nr:hypothetical protein [Deltaproteobacteria bacterium]